MGTGAFLKIIHVYLLATVKYVVTFPYALLIGLTITETIIAVTLGGICGFYFFYYLSTAINKGIRWLQNYIQNHKWKSRFHTSNSKTRKIFTRKNRLLTKLRIQYGLPGIIITTPILLSIPLGAYLLNKYYKKRKHAVTYMLLSILGWTVIFSTLMMIFPKSI